MHQAQIKIARYCFFLLILFCQALLRYFISCQQCLFKNNLRKQVGYYTNNKGLLSFFQFLLLRQLTQKKIKACRRKLKERSTWCYMLHWQVPLIIYAVPLVEKQTGQVPDYAVCGHFADVSQLHSWSNIMVASCCRVCLSFICELPLKQ